MVINGDAQGEELDVIHFQHPYPNKDSRSLYTIELLTLALQKTQPSYGNFRIEHSYRHMPRNRVLRQLLEGKNINAFVAVTRAEWEQELIPIRIPLLKGLLSYRLLLIREEDQYKFNKKADAGELKKLQAGLRQQWTTTLSMQAANYPVVTGSSYVGLFGMLSRGRFDYFPRGINEVFDELETYKAIYPNIKIDSDLAIFLASPSYFFISPEYPRLAARISKGFEMMISDGSFDQIFYRYHSEQIKKAKLKGRKIIKIENKLLPLKTPLSNQALWYQPG